MNLGQAINEKIENYVKAFPFFDIMIAKIYSVNPITIQLANTVGPIQSQSVLLTESVIEKKIDIVEHNHRYYDSDTEGTNQYRISDNALQNVQVYENGKPLGRDKTNTKLIMNKGLEVGEKVLVLRAKEGKQFIILSRLYENKKTEV